MKRALLLSTLFLLTGIWFLSLGQVGPQAVSAAMPAITFTPIYGDEDAHPLVMLTEFNPWLPIIGSDSPSFVVYSTGQVIYRDRQGISDARYESVMLDEEGLQSLLDQLNVGDDFYALDDYYDLVLKTDQMTETIYVWTEDDGVKSVTIYGSLYDDPEARDNAPQAFLDLFDQIVSYRNRNAERWLPEKFEVMLWPWDTSGAADWPEDWPDLDSPFAVQRGEDQYSIYIDIDRLEAYQDFAENEDAVELGGQTWSFSARLPFPHEVVWAQDPASFFIGEATVEATTDE